MELWGDRDVYLYLTQLVTPDFQQLTQEASVYK